MTTTTVCRITIRDNVAYLDVPDPDVMQAIVDATSFEFEGVEFRVPAHVDKRTRLVRNSKFSVGLLQRVSDVIEEQTGSPPEVIHADSILAPKPALHTRIVGVEPRGYQNEAELASILNDRGIFRMGTGSGKTLVALQVIQAKRMRALIVVPTIDLLRQFRDYLSEHLVSGSRIGQLGDGVVDPQPVTVATIRTIAKVLSVSYESYSFGEYDDADDTKVEARTLREWVEQIGTLIIDEAHILGARVCFDVTTKIPAVCKYGMSASPWRDDGADLMIEAATGPVIYRASTDRLVREGYLMKPEVEVYDTSSWWSSGAWGQVCRRCKRQVLGWKPKCECGSREFRTQWTEAYSQEIVNNDIRNQRIADIVKKLDRPTLVLVKQVNHGKRLAKMIPDSVFLSGRDAGEIRQDAFDRMRSGELKVIIATCIADQGMDLPRLEALVLAGGGKSSTRHLQRIGRIVRPYPTKTRAPLICDFMDGHVNAWFVKHEKARRKIEQAEWDGIEIRRIP